MDTLANEREQGVDCFCQSPCPIMQRAPLFGLRAVNVIASPDATARAARSISSASCAGPTVTKRDSIAGWQGCSAIRWFAEVRHLPQPKGLEKEVLGFAFGCGQDGRAPLETFPIKGARASSPVAGASVKVDRAPLGGKAGYAFNFSIRAYLVEAIPAPVLHAHTAL